MLGIVNNDITKDTRVKRVVRAAANGFDSVILGFTNGHREEHASMGAVKVFEYRYLLSMLVKVNLFWLRFWIRMTIVV